MKKSNANGMLLMKSGMTAMEVIETIEVLKGIMDNLVDWVVDNCGTDGRCECCEEVEEAVNIKLPDFLLEEAGIPKNAKLCACTEENSGVVKVMEAEYKHDLSDAPEDVLQKLKSLGVSLSKLNKSLMSEEIVYGE